MASPNWRPHDVAPDIVSLPDHPAVTWRAASPTDLDGILDLYREISRVDHPNHVTTRSGLSALFDLSYFDAESDSLVGSDGDGRIIAVGMVLLPTAYTTLARSIIVGGVHPDYRLRGIGRELLSWQLARARQQLSTVVEDVPRRIIAFTDERAELTGRAYQRVGLGLHRYFSVLERAVGDPIEPVELDEGIRLIPYSPALSSAVHRARDEAFLDNWGSQPMSDEAWDGFVGRETFRPELSFAAVVPGKRGNDEVVGFILGTANKADWENQGFSSSYVSMVGVTAPWRGRRIAKALLAAHLQAARHAGYERVTLDVDSDSKTGALNLYTGIGFSRTHQKLCFALDL
ncbi:MAG TPA: GNAT family N-acetyltransferase [Glaciibacter sp.]|nr:GNAT family N-acetyltransferase [Glaciibacter sp.]